MKLKGAEIVWECLAREGVDLVDFEAMLEGHADGEPIGCRYFGDVHAGKP